MTHSHNSDNIFPDLSSCPELQFLASKMIEVAGFDQTCSLVSTVFIQIDAHALIDAHPLHHQAPPKMGEIGDFHNRNA